MKLKWQIALLLAGLTAFVAKARDAQTDTNIPTPPDKEKLGYAVGMNFGQQTKQAGARLDTDAFAKAIKDVLDGKPTEFSEAGLAQFFQQARTNNLIKLAETQKHKVSYAMGMRLGLQIKNSHASVDMNAIAQGVSDVLAGKPTKLQPSEIMPIFRQEQAYEAANMSQKNKVEGEAFLAKNAKEPGVQVLPDGLQYRILKTGTGEVPKTNDLVFIKYRGTLVDGKEFDHEDHLLSRTTAGIKGWQEALQKMTIGSKWQIVVPPALAFGHPGQGFRNIGPDATLIYELELLSIAPPDSPELGSGRLGHGMSHMASDLGAAAKRPESNTTNNNVPPAKN
jgi:FKBP-type peptidyl-prolyl cis-trans isomerase